MTIASDHIDPVPAWPTVRHGYASAGEAFDAGNYPVALDMSAPDSELRAAAVIMCGAIAGGLEQLKKFESPRARLIRAYAHWCLRQSEDAKSLLLEIRRTEFGSAADRFLDILNSQIDVVMLSTPGEKARWAYQDVPGMRVHWIQLDAEQFGISMADALAVTLPAGSNPKLLLSLDAYGPYMPSAPKAPGIPVAYWASDHDYFFATRHADFDHADVIIVNSAAEQVELTRHYASRCAAIPRSEEHTSELQSH